MKILKHPWLFLITAILLTLIIKIPHLKLPFFFDETYSYYPAILEMAKTGPTLLPGSIPLLMGKGHPLFFFYLGSLWVKYIAGDSIALTHAFPLFIAIVSLFVFHRFIKRHLNNILANILVLLFALQTLFLAQASLLLPEILLFTLLILSFDFYLSGNYKAYAIVASLMILTKETGAVFLFVFGLAYLIENYHLIWKKVFWIKLLLIAFPAIVYACFLVLHHIKFGSFFFSEHLGYITLSSKKVLYNFKSSTSFILFRHGRNMIFFPALLSLIYLLFAKRKISHKRILLLSLSLLFFFFAFTIVNFYVYRYLFPILGISLLIGLILIQQVATKYRFLNYGGIAIIFAVSIYYSATKRGGDDSDLGYVQFLPLHLEMVEYCEEQGWYDKEFGAGYNMVMSMRDDYAGYLNTEKNFTKMHHLPGIKDRDLVIYDSSCWNFEMPEKDRKKLKLIKRFEYKKHWSEVYKVVKNR